jgi:hypothetical protein
MFTYKLFSSLSENPYDVDCLLGDVGVGCTTTGFRTALKMGGQGGT